MKAKVKDILNLIDDNDKVVVTMYAYGIYYGDTMSDGMTTALECKKNMNSTCMNSVVTGIGSAGDNTLIYAEIVH